MADSDYFSPEKVKIVADEMARISKEYDQLFSDLGAQIFMDIVDKNDASFSVSTAIKHIETAVSAFGTYFNDNTPIACSKGCSYCCYFPVEAPPQVIIDIAGYIKSNMSDSEINGIKKKLENDIEVRTDHLKRFPCPFLNEENSCSIYEKRPLACRWFTSPDSNICKESVKDGRNIPQHPILHRIFQAATTALIAAAKKNENFCEQLLFAPSLLKALNMDKGDEIWPGHFLY